MAAFSDRSNWQGNEAENSLATVHKHITNLEKKGLLTRDYNRSRSIDLLPPKGRLQAGDEREHERAGPAFAGAYRRWPAH